ncbi:MAG: hypothetical protein KIT72_05855 [Polyangiaceae bacterium]|nr:hypothetical protein [Polyangiaceae bacterium]MCW5789925.1 hypothetical protein [Polyangiaceae bacterium]
MSEEASAAVRRLAAAARSTAWRLRLGRTLSRAARFAPLPLGYALLALTWIKVWRPALETQAYVLMGAVVPLAVLVVATLMAWFERGPRYAGALRLDQHHQLHDRVATALEFSARPAEERTPFMEAAIADAWEVAPRLSPREAAPLRLPAEAWLVPLLALCLILVGLLEVRTERLRPALPPQIDALVVTPDDIELFRQLAEELRQENQDPEVQAAVSKFNQLVEDIAAQRLDRREVFRRMEALERELMRGAEADKEARDEGLKALAKELEKSDLTKPVAKPLAEKKLADAEEALKKLAERLRDKQKPLSKEELSKLRDSLKKAAEANASRAKAAAEAQKKVEEERRRLLKKKEEAGLTPQEKSLLKKKERELERLDRERDRADRAQRQLSRLDRELAKAAEDLLKEAGLSAKDLEAAAEDINRMAKQEMTDEQKEQLKKRLQEMRELLRQQGQGGAEQTRRLMRFGQRARGGQAGEGQPGQGQRGQQGKEGQGEQGDGQPGQRGQRGQGQQPGQGQGQGAGQSGKQGGGQGSGSQPGGVAIGPGGQPIPIPGQGSGQGGERPGQGSGQGGDSWGTGHDPNLKGEKNEIAGRTRDVTAVAADTGEGKASSQVIQGAAQRGFVGRGYKQVYTDYQTVAEDVMNKDDIPPGYRFYVRRYFQLIRPRD